MHKRRKPGEKLIANSQTARRERNTSGAARGGVPLQKVLSLQKSNYRKSTLRFCRDCRARSFLCFSISSQSSRRFFRRFDRRYASPVSSNTSISVIRKKKRPAT